MRDALRSAPRHPEAGLSLIEVMVSMMLLSVALLGLAMSFPSARTAVVRGDQLSKAIRLAQQTLEDMRNVTYDATTDDVTAANFPDQNYNAIANYAAYRRQITITDNAPEATCTPAPGTPCTKTVRVAVFYRDESGQEQSVALQTIFIR